jgi:glucose-6-phosphate 1-epimerase
MTDAAELNTRFGIAGQLRFTADSNGFVVLEIDNDRAGAAIALQGAHLLRWAPHNQQPVIWLSEAARLASGKAIRGGIPVCWPWFGPHPGEAAFPAHGFARTALWEVRETQAVSGDVTEVVLRLVQDETTSRLWPYPSELECRFRVSDTLQVELVSRNTGETPITIGAALHTYFAVSDIRQISLQGLDGCGYLDKVDGGRRKQQAGPVTFHGETDRIYLNTAAEVCIDDPGLQRRIRIGKGGSRSTVVWNPWIEKADKMGDLGEEGYLSMVCVETANAADDVVTIAPGGEHRLWAQYGVEAM